MFNCSLIPPVYYPACVVLLDDNESFLMSLSLGLDEDIPYLTFSNPDQAIEELQQRSMRLVANDLPSLLASPKRFDAVSVVVVDKSMPAIDGIEFCAQLNHAEVKTILLTGVADVSSALHAIQAGIIDAYINKGELSALHKLNHSIKEFSAQQFSTVYAEKLAKLGDELEVLRQDDFIRIFQALCKQHAIVEFYLLEEGLQFLLLDQQANAYLLSFYNKEKATPEISNPLFVADQLVKPASIMGMPYHYLWASVRCQLPVYSFARYMKEIWQSKQ